MRPPTWLFGTTIFLGAFLIFLVQPMLGKALLPWFGGASSVWITCLFFFQAALFAEYVYAHLCQSRLSLRGQAAAQAVLLLLGLALGALPMAPALHWKPDLAAHPLLRILMLLAATVGAPYLVLSTTSPLLQAWLSRVSGGRATYRFFALSNAGSLLGLAAYPFVVEPLLDLRQQAWSWSAAYLAYTLLFAACAHRTWRAAPARQSSEPRPSGQRPDNRTRGLWLLLSGCGSLMLLAATNHLCQEVLSVPLAWVALLALYLISFILCFGWPRCYVRGLWPVLAAAVAVSVYPDLVPGGIGTAGLFLSHAATLLCVCMVFHGELVRKTPAPEHLTEFYLFVAAGGALGGAATGLAVPVLSDSVLEWPIALAAGLLASVSVLSFSVERACAWLAEKARWPPRWTAWSLRGLRLILAGSVLCAGTAGVLIIVAWRYYDASRSVEQVRTFYGVLAVTEQDKDEPSLHRRTLRHGGIIHGQQVLAPDRRGLPTTYYTGPSGISRAMRRLQERRRRLRVGVVGLGVGTLASFARPGDAYVFYEIDSEIERLARRHFTYLSDAAERGAQCSVVLGDARLSLER